MARFPVPDAGRLESLIAQAYEHTRGPDAARINEIAGRLSQRHPVRPGAAFMHRIPWWIVLLLAGGLATAAWWAGDVLLTKTGETGKKHVISQPAARLHQDGKNAVQKSRKPESGNDETQATDTKESPIIYRREQF
ncbi:MAG: hypothetical protein ACE5GZ_05245 [Gammaproteobacteria bacterium]